jgi:branched-subunit amino acid transport protein
MIIVMPEPLDLLAVVLTATAITWTLRALPFALLAPLRKSGLIRFSVITARSAS